MRALDRILDSGRADLGMVGDAWRRRMRARQCLGMVGDAWRRRMRARQCLGMVGDAWRRRMRARQCLGMVGDAWRRRMRARQCLAPTLFVLQGGAYGFRLGAFLLCMFLLAACAAPQDKEVQDPQQVIGETIYRQYCFSCHSSGINGAPRTGDAEAFRALAEKGEAQLLEVTKTGIAPFMPENGLCMTCSDAELLAAIDYMMKTSMESGASREP